MNNPEYSLIALLLNYPENYEKVEKLPNIFKERRCKYIFSIMKKQLNFSKSTIYSVIEDKKVMTSSDFYELYEYYFEEENIDSYIDYVLSRYSTGLIIDYASKLKRIDYKRYDEIIKDIEGIVLDIEKTNEDEVNSSKQVIEKMQKQDGTICNLVKSGIAYIDRYGGYESTDFVIIAARPSNFKTTYTLNLIGQDIVNNIKIGFFTVETHKEKIMSILACLFAGVSELKYRTNELDNNERERLSKAFAMLYEKEIYLDATPGIKLKSLKKKAYEMVKKNGVKKLYIDYLQLINHYDKNIKTRYDLITYISKELKQLGRELEVPIICLAQLNRLLENSNREPRKSDLKESGAIEQDADIIILLHPNDDKIKNIVDKWRNGPQGSYYTLVNKELRRIREYG